MSLVKDLRHCLLKHRGLTKMIYNRQLGAFSVEQRRNFRYDDRFNKPTGNREDGKILTEEGFDPRYDERHYKSYQRSAGFLQGMSGNSSAKDPESRRRIQQDMYEHQKRQERIIRENKSKWQHRSEPRTGLNVSYAQPIYGAGPGKRADPAEEYSRKRTARTQRQKEVRRQARELRESRKNYNLPGYNRPAKSEAAQDAPAAEKSETAETSMASFARQAWLEKQAREDEQKYWHTWNTCPDQRTDPETAADNSEEIMTGYRGPRGSAEDNSEELMTGYKGPRDSPRGLTKPPKPYGGGVRKFQTHSVQLIDRKMPPLAPPQQKEVNKALPKRIPSGCWMARESDVTLEDCSKCRRQPKSLLQSDVFRSAPLKKQSNYLLQDIELPKAEKLTWQGLPQPVFKRFAAIKKVVARNNHDRKRPPIQPPRFKMTVKSKGMMRKRAPIDCFSDRMAINTRFTPHSEYLGFGRQTVCDVWQNFTNGHN